MKLLILSGLPASGKSTWAKNYCAKNKDWVRINRDDLRYMRGEYWIPKQEKLINDWENQCMLAALQRGYNVILDATNLNKDRNKERVTKLQEAFPELTVSYKKFEISLEEAINRDLKRSNSVGEKAIRAMYERYLAPKPVVYEEKDTLPHCIIFDVDGTLAKMHNRGPFQWDKVQEDKVNEPIANLARTLYQAGKKIIIMTGRDGICKPETVAWLKENEIFYHELFIRPARNSEKDAVIKKRMFEENIRGKYYVDFVVDDRDQVVDMWRKELGLTCLQVDYGDF
ncbi:MAG: AAA family ATPase [Bacteroidota bacterium]